MSAPKGGPKNGGRKKGTPNKSSASVKAAFLLAFDAAGGDKALAEWAKANRTEFYKLYAKLLPTEIKNADGEVFRVEMVEEIVDAPDEDAK
jgi:hypothetical protein